MELIKTQEQHFTSKGEPRGYIDPHALQELWFHTGTACNLACPFCLEGSKPGDTRLQAMTLEDARPFIDEALHLNVERFSFTGGEPFVIKGFPKILEYAARFRPCLVLTNGTRALTQRLDQIQNLANGNHSVSFRISIDYPEQALHDAGRGEGSFRESLEGIKALLSMGLEVSVARQMKTNENTAHIEQQYRNVFNEFGIPDDTHLVAFPDFLSPCASANVPEITQSCMTQYQTEENRRSFMCAYSKMLIKTEGKMRVYACTLVDDNPHYDMGSSLTAAMEQRVMLHHHRCYSCFAYGASCSG